MPHPYVPLEEDLKLVMMRCYLPQTETREIALALSAAHPIVPR